MMVCWIRFWQQSYLFFTSLIILTVTLITSGCGDGISNDSELQSSQTSSASLKIRWHNTFYRENSEIVDLAAALDCQTSGVESVVCEVYGPSGNRLATGGPWPCTVGRGRVDGIPSGADRTFVVLAENADNNISYHGQTPGITIMPNQVTEGIVVEAYPFIPNLTDPEDGVQLDPNSFSFEWERIETANQYLVQVAEDVEFQSIVINETIGGVTYVPTTLSPSTTYFWRIMAVDLFSNIGVASQVRSFVTTDCTYTISSTENSFGQQGGSGSFDVTSSSGDCEWTTSISADWITISAGASGRGDGSVSYTVAANTLSSERTGTIIVGGQSHTITQEGLDCTYQISPPSNSFPYQGGDGLIQVTTSAGNCPWNVSSSDDWISVSPISGIGDGTVTYIVTSNPTAARRDGNITIAGQIHRITQEFASDEIPTVNITYPTDQQNYTSDNDRIDIRGTAFDDRGVAVVNWSNSLGGNGTCSGTTSWSANNIALSQGDNVITVTARDTGGNIGNDVLTVRYNPPVICEETIEQGGDTPETHNIEMGQNSGIFWFSYDTYIQEDIIIIRYEGEEIFNTGCVGEASSLDFWYEGSSTQITVEVIPNCNGGSGTQWNFRVECPI